MKRGKESERGRERRREGGRGREREGEKRGEGRVGKESCERQVRS
jgi:hypothetical protein